MKEKLLSMDRLKDNNKRFVLKYFNETNNIKKANELISFFSNQDSNNNSYGDFILSGRLDKLNEILRY